MKIAVAYVNPLVDISRYHPLAERFAQTYRQFRPSIGHELHILENGGQPAAYHREPFAGLPATFHTCSNVGWDIGSFQWAADALPCDLLVCLGAPVHFHKRDWLEAMADAYVQNGPALFGCWAYLSPNWHVRTTCFWMPPQVLGSYPYRISSTQRMRYDFEHGDHSITRHVLSAGLDCLMVTRQGTFPFDQWHDHAPGVEDSLVLDQFTHR